MRATDFYAAPAAEPSGRLREGFSLRRLHKWSPLQAWGTRLARRVGSNKARVALARKLAVPMHRVWIDGTEFRWSQEATTA